MTTFISGSVFNRVTDTDPVVAGWSVQVLAKYVHWLHGEMETTGQTPVLPPDTVALVDADGHAAHFTSAARGFAVTRAAEDHVVLFSSIQAMP